MGDPIEGLIRDYLRNARRPARREGVYPDAADLYRYLNDELEGAELERMLDHLKGDEEAQAFVIRAREMMDGAGWENEKVDAALVARAQGLMPGKKSAPCPHCGKPITPFKKPVARQKWLNAGWLALAVLSFALSFSFRRYFMQFLAVAVLAGMKAIVELRATKTQILIYKALSEETDTKRRELHEHLH